MRDDYYTQCFCVSEMTGPQFEARINEILKTVKNPRIELDHNRSFTAYIFYNISVDVPETVTEALQLLEGTSHNCAECPYCIKSEDKRRKWHYCDYYHKKIHEKSPVCANFYRVYYQNSLIEGETQND